jgi:hypothetical protein
MADGAAQAKRIGECGKALDYEQEAIDAIKRSWELDDPTCQALALADAQAWATLHLARTVAARSRDRRNPPPVTYA